MEALSFTRGVDRFEIVPTCEAGYEGRLNGVPVLRDPDRGVVARRLLQGTCQSEKAPFSNRPTC